MNTLILSFLVLQTFCIFIVYPLWNMTNANLGYKRYQDIRYVSGPWFNMKIIPMVGIWFIFMRIGALLLKLNGD